MKADVIHWLNRLLAIHCRSFPQYLRWSRPHVPAGRGEELETLEAIALDQDVMAERISRMIVDADALPRTGEFPMEFTDLHDLDIDYLIAHGRALSGARRRGDRSSWSNACKRPPPPGRSPKNRSAWPRAISTRSANWPNRSPPSRRSAPPL